MAKKYLKTAVRSEITACNATPYGYPSPGVALSGGIVEPSQGGVGWTVEQFPEEESDTGSTFVVEVDDSKVPETLKASLKAAKPAVKDKVNNLPGK